MAFHRWVFQETQTVSSRVEPLRLFSIPVFAAILDGFAEHREPLVRAILALRAAGPGLAASNQYGWHSERDLHQSVDPHLAWLATKTLADARQILTGTDDRAWALGLVEAWAMVLDSGGWSAPHQHFPAAWSGVIYVDAEHAASRDRNDRAGKLELVNPVPMAERFGQPAGIVIGPQDGLFVLFPGSLSHFVHPVRETRPRISVSVNFGLSGRH